MNQKKIGAFLKELRKEKNLTQEQLAEKMFVSSKTVSRWETGNNMPDISLLIELADFYEVDIREMVNGERNSEMITEETRDLLNTVAAYTDAEKKKILKDILGNSILTLVCLLLGYAAIFSGRYQDGSSIYNVLFWIGVAAPPIFTIATIWDIVKINRNMGREADEKLRKILLIGSLLLIAICIPIIMMLLTL